MKQLYVITKKLASKYNNTERPVKNKNGAISTQDQLKRCAIKHFEELLIRQPSQLFHIPAIVPDETDISTCININRPSKNENKSAFRLRRDPRGSPRSKH